MHVPENTPYFHKPWNAQASYPLYDPITLISRQLNPTSLKIKLSLLIFNIFSPQYSHLWKKLVPPQKTHTHTQDKNVFEESKHININYPNLDKI